ncbi:MAG: cytochrome b/b6 domain-containing protein [Sphingomonadaceae bacterium]
MTKRRIRQGARYSIVAIVLHWTIAALMIAQVPVGWQMGIDRSAKSFALFQLHKSIGITILLLTLARILWRLVHRPPPLTVHGWEAGLARFIHRLFYVLLLALPLSGWLAVSTSKVTVPTLLFGVVPWPHLPGVGGLDQGLRAALHELGEEAHELMVLVFFAALLLHVAGALKHHWIDRDGSFARMAPGVKSAFHPRLLLIFALIAGAFVFGRFFVPPLPEGGETAPVEQIEEPAPPTKAEFPAVTPIDRVVDQIIEEEKEAEAADPDALARWMVQPGGTLGFTTQWSGNTLDGHFRNWEADINFGRNALEQSRVTVRIQTGSATTGQGQPDQALPGEEWFAAQTFPTATFNASKFRRAGNGFEASGTLMIKGKSRPVTLPFTLDITGDTARMKGSVTIDRIAYGVGWPTIDDVPAEVTITVDLTAKRAE